MLIGRMETRGKADFGWHCNWIGSADWIDFEMSGGGSVIAVVGTNTRAV